jgi:nucleoid DNA-binding protein
MSSSNKLTKAQFITALSESAGLDKKTVNGILDAIADLVKRQLGPEGPGEITIPGLVKLKAKASPATQDREGLHPITKQPMIIKGKPASRKIRASAIKALKDTVAS